MRKTTLQSARREIKAHADMNRAVSVEPFTLVRWALATKIPELGELASKNRQVAIQPYTFTRWLTLSQPDLRRGSSPSKDDIDAWARGVSDRAASARTERKANRRTRVRPGGRNDV